MKINFFIQKMVRFNFHEVTFLTKKNFNEISNDTKNSSLKQQSLFL